MADEQPKFVIKEGYAFHHAARKNPDRYVYIGKDMSSDGQTPAFMDFGSKAQRLQGGGGGGKGGKGGKGGGKQGK